METTRKKNITFSNTNLDFYRVLNKRVNTYFKSKYIGKNANSEMVWKTIIMFSLYLLPYILILTGIVTNIYSVISLLIVMGIGAAGIGLSVMHDANHGAYSKNRRVNNIIGRSLEVLGGSSFNWKMQHNVMHHTYTNVHDEDEDISPRGILRFSPGTPWKRMHRYQHIYAWFFYGMMTIVWLSAKDFNRLSRYHKNGIVKKYKANIVREWVIMIGYKMLYISYIFILPLFILDFYWWQILIGILILQYVTGFILAIIFQPAHVFDGTEYPLPDVNNSLEHNWAIHQLYTTTNYWNKNSWFSWYVGGLNFQIEHHLFPGICHVHYSKIAEIVKSTAMQFEIPYNTIDTFAEALISHQALLKQLGKKPTELAVEK